jgi:hypothetical protein
MINIKETNLAARFYKRFYGDLPKNVCHFLRNLILAILAMPFFASDFLVKPYAKGCATFIIVYFSVIASCFVGETFSFAFGVAALFVCAATLNLLVLLFYYGIEFIFYIPKFRIWKKIPCSEINWIKKDQ